MNKIKNHELEEFDVIAILIGFMMGGGIFALPAAVSGAKQDAWIAVIIGGIHPLIFAIISSYYIKKHPNENILVLSEKYLGKILGTICNILFMLQFGLYVIFVSAGLCNIFRVYAVSFLSPIQIYIPAIFLIMYLTNKGIKAIVRINKIAFYFTIILSVMFITSFQKGTYLNLLPFLGTSYKDILKNSIESAYVYGGMEGVFLIYPMVRKKEKFKSIIFKTSFIIIFIYTWITFITTYYLGYKVTSKCLWPGLLLTEGVNSPIINSFRIAFLLFWSFVMFKVISDEYYAFSYTLIHIFKIKNKSKIYYITYPIIIYFCLNISNEVVRRDVIGSKLIPKVTVFNIVYCVIIAVLIFINDKLKKKNTE